MQLLCDASSARFWQHWSAVGLTHQRLEALKQLEALQCMGGSCAAEGGEGGGRRQEVIKPIPMKWMSGGAVSSHGVAPSSAFFSFSRAAEASAFSAPILAPHLYAGNADAWSVGAMPCTRTHTRTHTNAFAQLQRAAEYLEAQEALPICAEHRYTYLLLYASYACIPAHLLYLLRCRSCTPPIPPTLPICAEHRYNSYCLLKSMCLKCLQPLEGRALWGA